MGTELNKAWFIIVSKPLKEAYAESNLRLRNIEAFYPKLSLPHPTKSMRQVVSLFPNYLFARMTIGSADWYSVKWCPGVKEILSFGGNPARIDESIVAFLKLQAGLDGVITGRCSIRVGQEVRIDGGPLRGLVGVIKEPPDAKDRVKVLLTLVNRPLKVDLPLACLRAQWGITVASAQPEYI